MLISVEPDAGNTNGAIWLDGTIEALGGDGPLATPMRASPMGVFRTARQPRPSNGMVVALMLMNSTFASSGRFAM